MRKARFSLKTRKLVREIKPVFGWRSWNVDRSENISLWVSLFLTEIVKYIRMKLQLLLLLICFRFGLQSHSAEVHGVDLATATTVWTKITPMNLHRQNHNGCRCNQSLPSFNASCFCHFTTSLEFSVYVFRLFREEKLWVVGNLCVKLLPQYIFDYFRAALILGFQKRRRCHEEALRRNEDIIVVPSSRTLYTWECHWVVKEALWIYYNRPLVTNKNDTCCLDLSHIFGHEEDWVGGEARGFQKCLRHHQ